MGSIEPRPIVFLDRDGVLIENREHFVRTWEDVEFFPQAMEACIALSQANYAIVVVTNQSCVGRGILTLEYVTSLNQRIVQTFMDAGANILGSYICPHRPDEGCGCRKPLPGMLIQAAEEHGVDLARSYLVGDALTDVQAADAAGVTGILVRTGRGGNQEDLVNQAFGSRCAVHDNLLAATSHILAASGVRA